MCRRCTHWWVASISGLQPDGYLKQVIAEIKALDPDVIIPMHCSGDNFARAVRETMPDKLIAGDWRAPHLRRIDVRRAVRCARHLLLAAFVGGIVAGVAGWLSWPIAREPQRSAAELMDVVMWVKEPIGGPSPSSTTPVSRAPMPTSAASSCWSISASPLARTPARPTWKAMASAVDKLGPAGDLVQPLFITVDPELDTPEQLKTYVALFLPG